MTTKHGKCLGCLPHTSACSSGRTVSIVWYVVWIFSSLALFSAVKPCRTLGLLLLYITGYKHPPPSLHKACSHYTCNVHSIWIQAFTLGCALRSICILMCISETTLGGGFDAHSPCRFSFVHNHVMRFNMYCVTSIRKLKERGGLDLGDLMLWRQAVITSQSNVTGV